MQQSNPDLLDQVRRQMGGGGGSGPSAPQWWETMVSQLPSKPDLLSLAFLSVGIQSRIFFGSIFYRLSVWSVKIPP